MAKDFRPAEGLEFYPGRKSLKVLRQRSDESGFGLTGVGKGREGDGKTQGTLSFPLALTTCAVGGAVPVLRMRKSLSTEVPPSSA